MDNTELRANAMLREVSEQSRVLGNRAANHAGTIAELLGQIEALKARIAELEKPSEAAPKG
jgi:hypothetical protein